MPRGMTRCRFCGKPIPSIYRQDHEKRLCRVKRGLDPREPIMVLPENPSQQTFDCLPRTKMEKDVVELSKRLEWDGEEYKG